MNRRKFLGVVVAAPIVIGSAYATDFEVATVDPSIQFSPRFQWQEQLCGQTVDFFRFEDVSRGMVKCIVRWRDGKPIYALGAETTYEQIAQDVNSVDKRLEALRFSMKNTINIRRGNNMMAKILDDKITIDGEYICAPLKPEGCETVMM